VLFRSEGLSPAKRNGQPLTFEQRNRITETFINVKIGTAGGLSAGTFGNTLQTLVFPDVVDDVGGLYSSSTGFYTVPTSGIYQLTAIIRATDESPIGENFGLGIHSSNTDGPWIAWATIQNTITFGRRTSLSISRQAKYTAGENLRAFIYADNPALTYTTAEMQIFLLSR
jgi:hypothetical protein